MTPNEQQDRLREGLTLTLQILKLGARAIWEVEDDKIVIYKDTTRIRRAKRKVIPIYCDEEDEDD